MGRVFTLFSLWGRARRRSYAVYVLVSLVAFVAWSPILLALMIKGQPDVARASLAEQHLDVPPFMEAIFAMPMATVVWANIAAAIVVLVLFWIWIAISVRRLHDMNQTGWLVLLAVLVSLVPYLGYALVSLVLGLVPGTRGRNGYGLDPRGREPQLTRVFDETAA